MNQGRFNITNSCMGNSSPFREHYCAKAKIKLPFYSVQPVSLVLLQALSKVLPITFAYVYKFVTIPFSIINRINAKGTSYRLTLGCLYWVHSFPVNFKPVHLVSNIVWSLKNVNSFTITIKSNLCCFVRHSKLYSYLESKRCFFIDRNSVKLCPICPTRWLIWYMCYLGRLGIYLASLSKHSTSSLTLLAYYNSSLTLLG